MNGTMRKVYMPLPRRKPGPPQRNLAIEISNEQLGYGSAADDDESRGPMPNRRVSVPLVVTIAAVLCVVSVSVFGVTSASSLARMSGSRALSGPGVDSLLCGKVAKNFEYHTSLLIQRVPNIYSEGMCCAACSAHPSCKVWSWGERRFVSGFTNSCYLRHLFSGEAPRKIPRLGVVSGILLHRIEKHGVVANAVSVVKRSASSWNVERQETCRGRMGWTGYGRVQVVNAQRLTPGLKSTTVDVAPSSWELVAHLRSRAFFAEDTCTAGKYDKNQFLNLKLLGRTMHYTVDMSGAGCGCNAQLMLVPMRRDHRKLSQCGDYFCGPAQKHVCGETCHAIRLQDANQYAWSTSVQLEDDEYGVAVGFGGGLRKKGRREWNQMEYGSGGSCIDTMFPFEVDISFQVAGTGVLEALTLVLWQPGQRCNLTARIDEYGFRGRDGLKEIGAMLEEGVTPVVSYWSSAHMQWLDGLGSDAAGPCVEDVPRECTRSVRFYDFTTRQHAKRASHPLALAFDDALMAIGKKVQQKARLTEEAEQLAKEAQMASMVPCTGSCGKYLDSDFTDGGGAKKIGTETKLENTEWEVVFDIVPVRRTPHYNGIVLRHKRKGQVVIGDPAGNWVRLLREPGWVAIKKVQKTTVIFLVPRTVRYTKLKGGKCETAGMFPIDQKETCQAASFALGYLDTFVNSFDNVSSRPFGCYLVKGQLFFVSNQANKGNDVGARHMLCSSQAYPTTTVTTTSKGGEVRLAATTTVTTTTVPPSSTTTTTATWTTTNMTQFATTVLSTMTATSTTKAPSTTTAPSTTAGSLTWKRVAKTAASKPPTAKQATTVKASSSMAANNNWFGFPFKLQLPPQVRLPFVATTTVTLPPKTSTRSPLLPPNQIPPKAKDQVLR